MVDPAPSRRGDTELYRLTEAEIETLKRDAYRANDLGLWAAYHRSTLGWLKTNTLRFAAVRVTPEYEGDFVRAFKPDQHPYRDGKSPPNYYMVTQLSSRVK